MANFPKKGSRSSVKSGQAKFKPAAPSPAPPVVEVPAPQIAAPAPQLDEPPAPPVVEPPVIEPLIAASEPAPETIAAPALETDSTPPAWETSPAPPALEAAFAPPTPQAASEPPAPEAVSEPEPPEADPAPLAALETASEPPAWEPPSAPPAVEIAAEPPALEIAEFAKAVETPLAAAEDLGDNMRAVVEHDLIETRAKFTQAKSAAADASAAVEASYSAARDGVIAINVATIEAFKAGADANFDLVKSLTCAKSMSEWVTLQTEFARDRFEDTASRAKEFAELARKVADETVAPIKAHVARAFNVQV